MWRENLNAVNRPVALRSILAVVTEGPGLTVYIPIPKSFYTRVIIGVN